MEVVGVEGRGGGGGGGGVGKGAQAPRNLPVTSPGLGLISALSPDYNRGRCVWSLGFRV